MERNLQLLSCLMLLLSAASANLVEDQQSGLERAPSLSYDGHRLRCFQHGEARIVQPYVVMQASEKLRVRRDPLGNGFYALVPLHITDNIKLPNTSHRQWHMLNVRRFKVQLRHAPCSAKCPSVSVSAEWRRNDSPMVRFRCQSRRACQRLLRSLRFNGERSRALRSALKFTFYGTANGSQFALTRVGLPIAHAVTRPFNDQFWFEGDKLVLFTIKSNIGLMAFETYQSEQSYPIPRDGSLPSVFRSDLLDQLATVASKAKWEIVAEMRKAGRPVAQAVFSANPAGLNKDSWFSPDRLLATRPYWAGVSGFNFFSIAGHADVRRRFFINNNYGGCPADRGFFVVSDQRDPCVWANQFFQGKTPTLVYTAYDNLQYQSGSAQRADNFLVYLRLARAATPALPRAFNFEPGKVLLFTVAANSGNDVVGTFLNSAIRHPMPTSGGLPSLYRSELIDILPGVFMRSGMRHIVAEMRAGNRMVAQVVFDISSRSAELNKENWFSQTRVVSSHPYPVGSGFNFFSIRGHADVKRSFFISYNYGGCPVDRAFWVVSETRDPCVWANSHWSGRGPALIYTASRSGPTLQNGAARYDADRFLVYLN